MSDDCYPYQSRKEHDFVNKMTVLIIKQRNIIDEATKSVNELQDAVDAYLSHATNARRKEDRNG